jgi:hypothetical protein
MLVSGPSRQVRCKRCNRKEIQTNVDAANRKKLARAAFAHVETVQNENREAV